MGKSLESVCQQLDAVEEKKSTTLRLDPTTRWDELSAIVLVLGYPFCLFGLMGLNQTDTVAFVLGVTASVLAAIALISFNEFWIVDFDKQKLELRRSLLKVIWLRRSYAFSEFKTLALDGRRRKPKNGSAYWEYGVVVLSYRGQILQLHPRLSQSYRDTVDVAQRFARLLDVPMLEPRPFGKVGCFRGGEALEYKTGQAIPAPEVRMEAHIHGDLTPLFPSAPQKVPVTEVRQFEGGRLEFEKPCAQMPQQGCAVVGLFFFVPWTLGAAGFFAMPGVGMKALAVVLLLPLLGCVYFFLDWLLFPITRQIEFVDGDSGQVGTIRVRGGGKTQVNTMDVPADAVVVNREVVGTKELVHRIGILQGENWLFVFEAAHTSQATKEKAEKIAGALGLPLEWRSDLD